METESDLVQELFKQEPKKVYRSPFFWKPYCQIPGYACNRRIELYVTQDETRKRAYLKIRNYTIHQEMGTPVSSESLVRLASMIFRLYFGSGVENPMNKKLKSVLLDFYFARRRHRKGKLIEDPYIFRRVLYDILYDREIYGSQVSKRYGVSLARGVAILHEMQEAGILKVARRVGRSSMYVFALENEEVKKVLDMAGAMVGYVGKREDLPNLETMNTGKV